MKIEFQNNEFTKSDILEYLTKAYGAQVNGKRFTAHSLNNWEMIKKIPNLYGGHRILRLWMGGWTYIPADSSIIAYSFQFIVIVLLVLMGVHFLSKPINESQRSSWSTKGLTIFLVLSL